MTVISTVEKNLKKSDLPEETLKANIKILNYIKLLASTTNSDISRWNISKLFGVEGSGSNFIADRKQINKIFFEYLKTKTDEREDIAETVGLPPEVFSIINSGLKSGIESKIKANKDGLERAISNFVNWSNDFNNHISNISRYQKQIDILSGHNPTGDIQQDLVECLSEGCWVNPVVKDNFLYLNTSTNIILVHKIDSANVDISIDFGVLAVRIDLTNNEMMVLPYKKNISASRYFHPHVSTTGIVCWGTARDAAKDYLQLSQFGKALKLLYAVLTSYNDSNPYIRIASFKDAKSYGSVSEALKHPDKIKAEKMPKGTDAIVSPIAVPLDEVDEHGDPIFRVGDRVQFEVEVADGVSYRPRWNYLEDSGPSGRYIDTIVDSVSRYSVKILLSDGSRWDWATRGNELYEEGQWSKPGYLRKVQ